MKIRSEPKMERSRLRSFLGEFIRHYHLLIETRQYFPMADALSNKPIVADFVGRFSVIIN